MDQLIRPQYYDGEYLDADDLAAIVRYARAAQARHTLGAHAWGIAIGLELTERVLTGNDVEVVLTPGVAWDGYGRTIVALAPQHLPLELFANIQDNTLPTGIPVEVWLAYRESPASPPGVGFACPDDDLHGRIVESFTIELRRTPLTDSHLVSIAGRSIDASNALKAFEATRPPLYDESVPQQTLPDSGTLPRWPIFVGILRWRKDVGQPGKLIQRIDDDRNNARKNRRYVGTIAETIYAPDGVLRLRDRSKDPADPQVNYTAPIVAPPLAPGAKSPNDLVWCEGNLRVVGDTRLQGGLLDYRLATGGDGGIPIYLRRMQPDATNPNTSLDAFVSSPPAVPAGMLTRFTISTDDPAKPRECFTLVTQRGTTKLAEVGINAAKPTNTLHVTGPTGIRYGFAYVTGDASAATSAFAFNAYMTPGGTWVLGDPALKPAALILDEADGVPQLRFQTSKTGNPPQWDVNVVVKGDTGNVGIGTTSPSTKLDVEGDMSLNGAAFINLGVWVASDARQKQSIQSISKPLEKLLALQGVTYAWRDPTRQSSPTGREHGFLAQDVETVFPEWVRETPKGTKAVNIIGFNAVAVEAMRELVERCDRMEKEIADLRAEVAGKPKSSGATDTPTPAKSTTRAPRRRNS